MKKIIFIFLFIAMSASSARGAGLYYTPDQSLADLKQGNMRFVAEKQLNPRLSKEYREKSGAGQRPKALVIACSDARVPVVSIFDQGIGDIQVVRVPGNVAGQAVHLAVWYAVSKLQIPLVLVLGHTDCDAVKFVYSGEGEAYFPDLAQAVKQIKAEQPIDEMRASQINRLVAIKNVELGINNILELQPELVQLIASNRLRIAGGLYNVESGLVEWLNY